MRQSCWHLCVPVPANVSNTVNVPPSRIRLFEHPGDRLITDVVQVVIEIGYGLLVVVTRDDNPQSPEVKVLGVHRLAPGWNLEL